ncbi:MAG TPA: cyclic nucleotide-binding domain-containing protein [Bdellovibrionota bacterium]|nr:cyclic nucleotide-binding domain-containing protein [Bdellovibrionota bacterium]
MSSHPHFLWADLFKQDHSEKSLIPTALRENVLFRTLSERELSFLSTMVYERVYEPGEPIFRQGDRGFGLYVIVKGTVAIKTQAQGAEHILVTKLGRGSFFGELSLLEMENLRSASALAVEKTILVGFFKPDLKEILDRKPAMGVKILQQLALVLGTRLIETTDRLAGMPQIVPTHQDEAGAAQAVDHPTRLKRSKADGQEAA